MDLKTINYIKNNKEIYHYLRENSKYYKELNRNPNYIKKIEELARKRYKLTISDKIEKLNENINLISTFIDVLK